MERHLDQFDDAEKIVDAIIDRVGKTIISAMPLGLGKATHIVNALVKRAVADPSINLQIFTALTLTTPQTENEIGPKF